TLTREGFTGGGTIRRALSDRSTVAVRPGDSAVLAAGPAGVVSGAGAVVSGAVGPAAGGSRGCNKKGRANRAPFFFFSVILFPFTPSRIPVIPAKDAHSHGLPYPLCQNYHSYNSSWPSRSRFPGRGR